MSAAKTRVVKFGGKSLSSPELVASAALLVAKGFGKGNRLAVVVSAQGRTTDELLSQLKAACPNAQRRSYDRVLSFGERLSASVFGAALESAGVPAVVFDPHKADWPVISDSSFGDAAIDFEISNLSIRLHVARAISGSVAVIPGFVAKTVEGDMTTLGRGGSDLTAFILARCLQADELVKVTDVDGFYVDGKKVDRAQAGQLQACCKAGDAELYERFNSLIQPKALEHFVPPTLLRIISHASASLDASGSVIFPDGMDAEPPEAAAP